MAFEFAATACSDYWAFFVEFRPDLSPTRQIGCDMNNTMTTHRNHFDGCAKVIASFSSSTTSLPCSCFKAYTTRKRGLKSKVDEKRLLLLEDGPRKLCSYIAEKKISFDDYQKMMNLEIFLSLASKHAKVFTSLKHK